MTVGDWFEHHARVDDIALAALRNMPDELEDLDISSRKGELLHTMISYAFITPDVTGKGTPREHYWPDQYAEIVAKMVGFMLEVK